MTKRIFHAAAILSLILTAGSVSAEEVDATTVLGGALGGGAGAAVGSAVGGRGRRYHWWRPRRGGRCRNWQRCIGYGLPSATAGGHKNRAITMTTAYIAATISINPSMDGGTTKRCGISSRTGTPAKTRGASPPVSCPQYPQVACPGAGSITTMADILALPQPAQTIHISPRTNAVTCTRCASMLPFAAAAVPPVSAASPACRPCKRSGWPWPYLAAFGPSFSPMVASAGSAPTAAPGVRCPAVHAVSLPKVRYAAFRFSPRPREARPLASSRCSPAAGLARCWLAARTPRAGSS